jgi:hypothetical protein
MIRPRLSLRIVLCGFIVYLGFVVPQWSPLWALDFDPVNVLEGQEADGVEGIDERQDEPPDIEAEPGEVRQSRSWAVAASVGESFPGAGAGVVALRTLPERAAWRLGIARGQRRFSGQTATGQVLARDSRAFYVDVGYEVWPAFNFPFVTSLGITLGDIQGKARPAGASSESYRMRTAAVGAEIVIESFFDHHGSDHGFWLRWVLLSGRFVQVISGNYGHLDGEAMSQVRGDHDGIQITGFANISAGYSW